jgi:hypothetical protein
MVNSEKQRYKIIALKDLKNDPVLYLGLNLTIHAIKGRFHLVRQSLCKNVNMSLFAKMSI